MKSAHKRTYYLVDLENTGPAGLSGAEKLDRKDRVAIFCAKNNGAKLLPEILADFNDLKLKVFTVPQKKQSVDFHIVSYLGYLIGKKPDAEFVIVSGDGDYDDVISFWKEEKGAGVRRRGAISEKKAKSAGKKSADEPVKPAGKKKKVAVVKEARAPVSKIQYNSEIQKALSKAKIDGRRIGEVAGIASKQYEKENRGAEVRRALEMKYGDSAGGKLFEIIKGLL